MSRSTQIRIIPGGILLIIMAVFFCTRSSIEEIDTNKLTKEPKAEITKKTAHIDNFIQKSHIILEFAEDESLMRSRWEKIGINIMETEIGISKIAIAKKEIEELPTTRRVHSGEKITTISIEEQQIATVTIQKKVMHKVASNDNLYNISKKYYGDKAKWIEIYDANKNEISDPNILQLGQELLIPHITTSKNEA